MIQASKTAFLAFNDLVYITGATAFAVSWNQFINSKIQTSNKQKIKKMKTQISIQKIINILINKLYTYIKTYF